MFLRRLRSTLALARRAAVRTALHAMLPRIERQTNLASTVIDEHNDVVTYKGVKCVEQAQRRLVADAGARQL